MQTVTAAFLSAISGDHTMAVKVEFLSPASNSVLLSIERAEAQLVAASQGIVPAPATPPQSTDNLRILDGSVTIDKNAEIRSHCNLKLLDPTFDLVPTMASDILTPFGNEVRIYRGVVLSTGTEYVLLGTFRISDVETDESSGAAVINITGYDRSRNVARNVLTNFYAPAFSATYTDAIRAMLLDRYPSIIFNDTAAHWVALQNDSTVITPGNWTMVFQEGSNIWTQARAMAKTIGCDLFFNREGVCVLLPDPNLSLHQATTSVTPVANFIEGQTATFTAIKRRLSDQTTFNRVIITGEGSNLGAPLRSVAADDTDTNSPTYISGPYGVVSYLETNSLVVTQGQADSYARLTLTTKIGSQELVEFPSIVNPALDVDDPITVTRTRVGVNSSYIIGGLTIPLRPETAMQCRLREKRALV